MTDDNNNKLRAVFLAALMVLWVFAGTVAFAGSTAAVSNGDLDNTDLTVGDSSADATTTYNVTTSFDNTSANSGVAAVELDLSDASQFGGDASNYQVNELYIIGPQRPGGQNVSLRDQEADSGTVTLDFENKENVSDDSTLVVELGNIENPSVDDEYDLVFRSYTDAGPSNDFESETLQYEITGDDGGEVRDLETNDDFSGGSTRWKGQILDFEATPGACNAENYQLRYYTPGDENGDRRYGALVREITLNDTNGAQIPTENVADDERVVIVAEDTSDNNRKRIVDVNLNGEQTANCYSDNSTDNDDDWVEVVPQTFSAEFEEDSIPAGDNATLDVESNRGTDETPYSIYVDSDDFTQNELLSIVNNSTNNDVNTRRAPSEDAVRVNDIQSSEEITFDFSAEDPGNYSFDLTPTDTTPEDNASIEITEPVDDDAEFDSDTGAFTVKRGDIQSPEGDSDSTISVDVQGDLDFVVLVIGEESRNNYETQVTAEPDANGNVDIRMNTFLAGQVDDGNESKAYEAENGTIVDVNRRTQNITGVLDEGQYEVTLQTTDGVELDAGVVNIAPSSYESLTQLRHPDAPLNAADEISEVAGNDAFTETNDTITMADRDRSDERDLLIHRVEISGIYGALDAIAENDLDNADGNQVLNDAQVGDNIDSVFVNSTILDVELEQINFRQNREPKIAGYQNPDDTDGFRFVIDEDNETVYLVTDIRDLELTRETATGFEDTQVETGDDYEFEFDIGPGFETAFEGGIDTYVPQGGTTTQFDVEDRQLEFDEQGADRVRVNNDVNQTISGQTNVAPFTELTIAVDSSLGTRRANDTETGNLSPVFQRGSATVQEDGTFADDSFDFSDNEVGREFAVSSPNNGIEDAGQKPGIVVEGTPASVAISDITVPADQDELSTVTVDSAYLPQGGFVTIHDGTLLDDAVFDSVRGTSDYIEADTEVSDVEVELDSPYTEDGTVIPMAHQDTNNNEEYDFVTSEGAEDGPYTVDDGPVIATGSVTFETPTPTPSPTPTATETPTETETATATPTSEDQPGFGAGLALIALLGAALLAARRNAF